MIKVHQRISQRNFDDEAFIYKLYKLTSFKFG